MTKNEIYPHFAEWLDSLLENLEMPKNAAAFNFNLYDEAVEGDVFAAQLIVSDRFDPDDEEGEWACYNAWSSEDELFPIDFSDEDDKSIEFVQGMYTSMIKDYLEKGKYKDILLSLQAIGIGHVEGDLDIIYKA